MRASRIGPSTSPWNAIVQRAWNPPDVQSSTQEEETVDYGAVVCARSYTGGTFTGSSTPVAPALAVY